MNSQTLNAGQQIAVTGAASNSGWWVALGLAIFVALVLLWGRRKRR